MSERDAHLQGARVLLVDDEPANLAVLRHLLEGEGYRVLLAPSGQVALRNAARVLPDLVLLDVMMPDVDGLEVCRRLQEDPCTRDIPVVFLTARDAKEDVIAGFEAGGLDYVTKPLREDEVLARVRTHVRLHRLAQDLARKNEELEREIACRTRLSGRLSLMAEQEAARWGLEGFVGESPTVQRILAEIRLMQGNPAVGVLITGESGTGKELVARAIHFGGPRQDGPFLPVNCAAMPAELVESLLLGHVKGAFTGADADREGYFEIAHGGTLFLDEISEMAPVLQAKLLRVLEDGEVWRIGATAPRKVDVRVLAATNADLQQRIQDGRFRRDLYFRLARFTVHVPPLRQRRADIPLLARHFLRLFAAEMGREPPVLGEAVLAALRAYDYPGNVRELKNVIERALIESGGAAIGLPHLHFVSAQAGQPGAPAESGTALVLPLDLDRAAAVAERWVVERAVELCGGNLSAATRLLGTNRNRVYRILGQGKAGTAQEPA
ncbi:MAG: sigma-54 dependent transcriptional regulator [Candidatus Latescibacterota bacterium]